MQAWGIHLPAPVCQQEQLLEQQGRSQPWPCLQDVLEEPSTHQVSSAFRCHQRIQGGSESREVCGGRGGLGGQGEDGWVPLWGQGLFSGGLVLSFGVSVSAQLLPFNTRDGHCAHKILTWCRTLKAAGLGNCWPF